MRSSRSDLGSLLLLLSSPVIITLDSDSSRDDINNINNNNNNNNSSGSSSPVSSQQTVDFSDLPPLPLLHSARVDGALNAEIGELPVDILDRGSDGSETEPVGQPEAARSVGICNSDNSDREVDVENVDERGSLLGSDDDKRPMRRADAEAGTVDSDSPTAESNAASTATDLVHKTDSEFSTSDSRLLATILNDLKGIAAPKRDHSFGFESSCLSGTRKKLFRAQREVSQAYLNQDDWLAEARHPSLPEQQQSNDGRGQSQSLGLPTFHASIPPLPHLEQLKERRVREEAKDLPPLLKQASPVGSRNRNTPPPLKHGGAGSQRLLSHVDPRSPHTSADANPGVELSSDSTICSMAPCLGAELPKDNQAIPPISTLKKHFMSTLALRGEPVSTRDVSAVDMLSSCDLAAISSHSSAPSQVGAVAIRRGASERECRTAMEHNAIQWLGAPSCQRGSYAFYKSVSSRAQPDGPVQVWKLGEFYFIRCGPQDPVCIAEVTLLWEDQTRHHLLASTRLYFLPEDTPKGRTREHGEDEVLAVSRKMVVRVEDLVRWSCAQPAGWSSILKSAPCGANGLHKPLQCSEDNNSNSAGKNSETLRDKTENDSVEAQGIKVLSYPQYCRFRSLQRRIQDRASGPGLQDPHLLALGAVKALPNTRLMYCRDTFSHPTLESNTSFSWQFRCPSLSLRGRPRKRRGRDGKDSPNSSQSESWIERMKENVMGSVEAGCEGSWLPHPEEQLFLDQLFAFMDRHGSPIHKVPNLGFKKIDLFLMYSVVKRLGGYKKVTLDRLWKVVYNELGGCPGSTSAATCTRRHYERLMLPYEEHLRAGGAEFKIPESPMPPKPRGIRGRKPLPRGRKPGPKKKITTPAAPPPPPPPRTVVNPNGTVVVKRGRGRPPGTRNKATLIAQAKLLAQQQAKAKAAAAESQPQSPLSPARGGGGPVPSSTPRPVQPAMGINMPLTPDLSPMSAPFLPFQPKPKELKPDIGESMSPAPGVLLSTLPRHFVGGSLGGFSPIKGVCPLDVFRSRISLQRGLESSAVTPQDPTQHHPTVYTLQPKSGSPDTPHPSGDQLQPQPHTFHQQHNRCSGCNVDEGAQRAGSRDARSRPPLPPLRVLPLNLDCSVQVCQLMRTRLGSSQFQTFTRRLSEALSQDLSTKPPCSPITPPPEQALPLNLSKRFMAKRPSIEGPEPSPTTINGTDQPSCKRPRTGCTEQVEDFSTCERSSSGGSGGGGGEQAVEMKNQEEPADLSSPSRIRAFLLGLPPFQVKFEEDLNGTRFGKFLPPGAKVEPQRTETENGEGGVAVKEEVKQEEEEEEVVEIDCCETERSNKLEKPEQEERDPTHLSGPGPAELKLAGPSNTDTHCF